MTLSLPPVWSDDDLTHEADTAESLFRKERLQEPVEAWKQEYERAKKKFEGLFGDLDSLHLAAMTDERIAQTFGARLGEALRYLAGPPISDDDLKVLADVDSLAPTVLASNHEVARKVFSIIEQVIDPYRFPWVVEKRAPTGQEKQAAILASSVLLAAQRLQTERRSSGKNVQEQAVKEYLRNLGLTEVPAREIRSLGDAPAPGEFCAESKVGERKADIPVHLYDGRLMPIECKVSNSSTNSVKRLNNDAQVKAGYWIKEFGTRNVVPVAMLSGVFKLLNLKQGQEGGLVIFWAHRMERMGEFINSTKHSGQLK